jgi:hypothetical protein
LVLSLAVGVGVSLAVVTAAGSPTTVASPPSGSGVSTASFGTSDCWVGFSSGVFASFSVGEVKSDEVIFAASWWDNEVRLR